MKTTRSSLSIPRVLEFKVKQLPVSNATISQYFTFCKRVGLSFSTIQVENQYLVSNINCYGQAKESLVISGTYHVREKAGSLRNKKLVLLLLTDLDSNPGQ